MLNKENEWLGRYVMWGIDYLHVFIFFVYLTPVKVFEYCCYTQVLQLIASFYIDTPHRLKKSWPEQKTILLNWKIPSGILHRFVAVLHNN